MLLAPILSALGLASLVACHPADHQHQFSSSPSTSSDNCFLSKGSHGLVKYIEDLRVKWGIPGVQVTVVLSPEAAKLRGMGDGGWVREGRAFGVRNGKGDPMTMDSPFCIASNSKHFVAITAGLLMRNDSLDLTWNTKVKDVLPEWKLMDDIASNYTNLVDLFSHRTGLPRHDFSYNTSSSASQLVSSMRYLRPSTEFRQIWQYNNLAFITGSLLSPTLTSIPYTAYVRDNIFLPAGMKSTTYNIPLARSTGKMVDGFVRVGRNMTLCAEMSKDGKWKNGSVHESCLGETTSWGWAFDGDGEPMAGAGGVISTGNDLGLWLQTLLSNGVSPMTNESIIHPSIIDAITVSRMPSMPRSVVPETSVPTYGMGQMIYHYRGHQIVEHGGAVTGQMSQILRIPSLGLGVAVLVNDQELGTSFHTVVKWRIIDTLLADVVPELEPINWEERAFERDLEMPTAETPRPENVTEPTGAYASIAGTYYDPAYGSVTFCPIYSTFAEPPQTLNAPDICESTIAGNPYNASELTAPTWLTVSYNTWASYWAISHFNRQTFNISIRAVSKETGAITGKGEEANVFVEYDGDGFGLGGNGWGMGAGVVSKLKPGMKDVKELAEVYFARVEGPRLG